MASFITTLRRGALAALALAAAACGETSPKSVGTQTPTPTSTTLSALATSVASSSTSTGTLLCAPTTEQSGACAGKAVADPCVLVSTDFGDVEGVCQATIDGKSVGCAPRPPAPPEALVKPCASKAAGDACTIETPFGNIDDGQCVAVPGDSILVCGRLFTPPVEFTAPCASAKAGDACELPAPFHDPSITFSDPLGAGSIVPSHEGVCAAGPAGTGALACVPAQMLLPPGAHACAGLKAGDACTLGPKHLGLDGACVTPAAGGDPVCQVACFDFAGPFRRHDRGDQDPGFEPWPVCTGHSPFDPNHVSSIQPWDPSNIPTWAQPRPFDPDSIASWQPKPFDPDSIASWEPKPFDPDLNTSWVPSPFDPGQVSSWQPKPFDPDSIASWQPKPFDPSIIPTGAAPGGANADTDASGNGNGYGYGNGGASGDGNANAHATAGAGADGTSNWPKWMPKH